MPRQPPWHRALPVVGHAAQQDLCDLWPIAARGDGPSKPALDACDTRRDCPPLARGLPGHGQWPLAARGASRQAPGWPPCDRRHEALEAEVFSPPAVVGLRLVAPIGQQARAAQTGPGLCHQGATLPVVPARPPVGPRPTPHQRIAPHRYRPLQPRAGTRALTGPPLVVRAGWGPRNARSIHGHWARARESRTLEHPHRLRQQARQQARLALGAAAPPPRGRVGHRGSPQDRPPCVGAGQQGCTTPIIQGQNCLSAQTGQPRWWRQALRGKLVGVVRPLGAGDLHRQACQAASIMAFHGASPPQSCI